MKKTHCWLKADSAISVLHISKRTGVSQTMIPREHLIDSGMYFNSFKSGSISLTETMIY